MFYVKVRVFLAEVLLKLGDFILRLDIEESGHTNWLLNNHNLLLILAGESL